jgi:diacylglycerol kinase (ATP)
MPDTGTRNIAVLCNPQAGAGKAIALADAIDRELSAILVTHTVFIFEWPANFNGFTDIFIAGGDGTLNYFVNHYPGCTLPMVIFNGGTGNDFHWMLYGHASFHEQLAIALQGNPKPIDIGLCNNRYFINGVGIGFEGVVARALAGKHKRPGKASFLSTILRNIGSYRSALYTITSESGILSGRKLLIDISNGRRAGGGFHIAPEAMADDGLFDIVAVDALHPLKRLFYLPVIEKGRHLHLPFIQHFQARHLVITGETPVQYHLDGEYAEADRLEIQLLPAAVSFRY